MLLLLMTSCDKGGDSASRDDQVIKQIQAQAQAQTERERALREQAEREKEAANTRLSVMTGIAFIGFIGGLTIGIALAVKTRDDLKRQPIEDPLTSSEMANG